MSYIFYNCSSLKSIPFISEFDTSNVLNMSYMFYKCSSLVSLDISNWNVSKVENMDYMFYNCPSLEGFTFISDLLLFAEFHLFA
jgi:surface protein